MNLHADDDNWMTPYTQYLKTGTLPNPMNKGWLSKVASYTLVEEALYKRGYSQPLLKCVTKE